MRFGRRRSEDPDELLPGVIAAPAPFPVTALRMAARKDSTVTDQFTRVDDGPQPLPLTAADPILRGLSRSGRADVMESIADTVDPVDMTSDYPPPPKLLAAAAHILRVLAPIERRR